MSELKQTLIKLGHTNPELRGHIKHVLDHLTNTDSAGEFKTASVGMDILESIIDERGLVQVLGIMGKDQDTQSLELLREIQSELAKRLDIGRDGEMALNRLRNLSQDGPTWNPMLIRNNIFKIANELGIKLPSGSF
jgi:hypothetical protein